MSYMPDMPDAVKMVEDMVSEYIKDDCIIIVTVPMAGMFSLSCFQVRVRTDFEIPS